ncbi:MAG: DegT/DnrJ/EryC1/StrS family aminotransferase [Candidatus Hodarchaeota archaeon]
MRIVNTIPLVDLVTQYATIKDEIDSAVQEVLVRCNFILGSQVEEFEQSFARFVGVKYAVAVSNGLDALRLSLMALDIGPGDEIILPVNTYIATALAVSSVGAQPVLVDCDPATYNIDVGLIEPAINQRVRAIIPVHLTGQSVDMDPILEMAERHGLYVIEDAAQAHGALYKGRQCGSLGIMGCFSFYPGKNLGACGDGGMVTTNETNLAERLRRLRNYGQCAKYEHVEKGLNARMDTVQAAILGIKLRHLRRWNETRAVHAEKYIKLLNGIGDIVFQQRAPYSSHVYHLFIIETDQRDALLEHLEKAGIQTGIHYPRPIHLQGAYSDLGYLKGDFPNAERLAARILSLPMFPELSNEQIHHIAANVQTFFTIYPSAS